MQTALDKNYFEIFGLPEAFDIDTAVMKGRYHDLQQQLHPDRFASATDQEKRLSVQMTALVNEAFQTLKNPLRRGRYLLQLRGIDTNEEIDTAMDPAFLMEQIELREALDAACDSARPLPELASLGHEVTQAIDVHTDKLRDRLSQHNEIALREARHTVRELQFLEKLAQEIEQREEEFIK
ncbi:MAG: Fe-S protein assembly co-chaperone HscB [Acidiferrobacterales bacterium]